MISSTPSIQSRSLDEFINSNWLLDDVHGDESTINNSNETGMHIIADITIIKRFKGLVLPCCSYTKHWSKISNGPPTSYFFNTNETPNLSFIDIDINKSCTNEQRITIRDDITQSFVY